jgi:hypothetical protein
MSDQLFPYDSECAIGFSSPSLPVRGLEAAPASWGGYGGELG